MITQEKLKELLGYDSDTGVFTWIVKRQGVKHRAMAGTLNSNGHRQIMVGGKLYLAHRLAFLYVTGSWPEDQTDHVNHRRDDNRWSNLREVSHTENGRNQSKPKRNTSGVVGIFWNKQVSKWQAQIRVNGKPIHLGLHECINAAILTRKAAEFAYDFHENHGK